MAILNFQKPDKVIMIDSTESHGKFEFRPLEPGYGSTPEMSKNLSNVMIPIGDGWHPYFKTSGKVENLWLKLPTNRKIEVNKRMIPTGKKTLCNKFSALSKIEKHQFDTGFALSKKRGIMSTELQDKEKNYSIILWQETGKMKYNYLQVFIPPSRNSIALEPMTFPLY